MQELVVAQTASHHPEEHYEMMQTLPRPRTSPKLLLPLSCLSKRAGLCLYCH